MEHLYIPRNGDGETLIANKRSFEKYSEQELVDTYNKSVKIGIVGVHQQGLLLIALWKEFSERYGESPVQFEENIIGLRGPIEIKDNKIRYIDD